MPHAFHVDARGLRIRRALGIGLLLEPAGLRPGRWNLRTAGWASA